jgi:hypothetical protein
VKKRKAKSIAECRTDACRKGWATRRRKAQERSDRVKRAWVTRRRNARRKAKEAAVRAERAKAGHEKRKARPKPAPRFIPIVPQVVYVKVEPIQEVKRAPEILTEDDLDAMIADFAARRIDPDLWARDLANQYDLEIGPLYQAYFAIVSPP